MENLSIPEGVEYIDWSAFEGCNDLLSIKFPSILKGIDRHAFWGATEHLNTVYFYGEKAPNLGDSWALIIPRWTKVYVPKGTSDDYCEKLRKCNSYRQGKHLCRCQGSLSLFRKWSAVVISNQGLEHREV